MRVLAPRGVIVVRKSGNEQLLAGIEYPSADIGNEFVRFTKPVPADIDEWTHYLHGPDNNAVSQDTVVAPPRRMQWQCGPLWSRSHETDMSMSGAVSAAGRMIYFIDEGPIGIHETPEETRRLPDKFSLVCRDAFNGVELWRRPVFGWGSRAWDDNRQKAWGPRDLMWASPATLPRRLVAVDNSLFVTLGYRTFLSQLDAATGRIVRQFKELGTVDEILAVDGKLVLRVRRIPPKGGRPAPETLAVVDVVSGQTLWKKPVGRMTDLTLAASQGRICFHDGQSLIALNLDTGEELWKVAVPSAKIAAATLVMYGDIVVLASGGRPAIARAFSVADGNPMWQHSAGTTSFRGTADLFAANGLIWMGTLSTSGLDPKTGEVAKRINVPNLFTAGHHARCYRARATENYLLWSKRGVEFVDLNGDQHSRNDWVRGTCRYGLMPANGLLYAPPTPCFCYPGVRLNGFNALAPGVSEKRPTVVRLRKGPAYDRTTETGPTPSESTPSDWPTYRHDNARSGSVATAVPVELKEAWKTKVGSNCTPPVLALGRLFLADKDTHTVHCLDAATGKPLWHFIAGGVVDSPPTVSGGRVLFGCTDGRVYCLSAKDGTLIWRFQAAPRDQRIVSSGQVQSSWPVHGSVLVKNDIAYVAAGRSSFLDGGIFLYGLDIATGNVRCRNRLDGPWPNPNEKSTHSAHSMDGGLTDILVCNDDKLYMMQNVFDLELRQLDAPVIAMFGARKMDRHLIASGGFLDQTGFDRIYWMHAARWPGLYYGYDAPKTGQILVFDQKTTYALHTFAERFSRSPYFAPGRDGYDLVADDNDNEPILTAEAARRAREPGHSRQNPPKWRVKVAIRARAMVLADDTLFLAGPPDIIDPDDPLATFEGRKAALLRAVSTTDGTKIAEYTLDAQPVFDGMIAVRGKLYLCMKDGTVRCWSK